MGQTQRPECVSLGIKSTLQFLACSFQNILFSFLFSLDGGAYFYQTYETKDSKYMAVGALEPQFFREFISKLGLSPTEFEHFSKWEENKEHIAAIFRTKTQEEWEKIFHDSDACVTPVQGLKEAPQHPHNVARESFFMNEKGELEPSPAPHLSEAPSQKATHSPVIGENSREILAELGFGEPDINELIAGEAVDCIHGRAKL